MAELAVGPLVLFFDASLEMDFSNHASLSCSVINGKHQLDEIKILQGDILPNLRKRELIKLIFFVICFFLYLYKYVPAAFLLFPSMPS